MNRRFRIGFALLTLGVAAIIWFSFGSRTRPLPEPAPVVEPAAPAGAGAAPSPNVSSDTAPPPSITAATPPPLSPPSVRPAVPGIAVATSPSSPALAANPQPAEAAVLDPGGSAPGPELEAVRYFVRDYRSITGENPVGTNAEITKALMGENQKGARLIPQEQQRLNAQGELVDRYGTPYFFHQLSKQEMEIRSAGPDRKMWTGDDEVTQ